ncbi:carboxypeptidase regulatory-like domain-containing protein [Bosea sp. CS1GBMeth4]|uniref:carboxypeptidase regulatory-like domain-containing protein n=1 Tax=Bosea sp. CS1GBMeth4 TaxID=1892849 RepID=UPI0016460873|nr:carboxypeptidase regulatory-like domain-containing protein [Bosea sp. CS1GBMeth4]
MRAFACVLGLAALLGSCVAQGPTTSSFSAEEAAFIRKPGTGVIVGHAFRTRSKGQVVNAAGEIVKLIPATEFARERFTRVFGKAKFLPHWRYPNDQVDPAYAELTRTTKTTANGRFTFDKVAPGSYFVSTQVIWGEEDAVFREGGTVYDEVTLTGKETEPVEVILSGH